MPLTWAGITRAGDGNRTRMTSLEGVWRTGVRAVELETLMLVSSRGYPLLTMVNGPLMAWRSWPDSYRSRPVRAAATTSAPWCCSPFRALPGASSAWPLSGWTRPLLPQPDCCRTSGWTPLPQQCCLLRDLAAGHAGPWRQLDWPWDLPLVPEAQRSGWGRSAAADQPRDGVLYEPLARQHSQVARHQ
jgi:hypothetical protein